MSLLGFSKRPGTDPRVRGKCRLLDNVYTDFRPRIWAGQDKAASLIKDPTAFSGIVLETALLIF